jgi:RNA polymerase sigma-70 factor, ECF subfamily
MPEAPMGDRELEALRRHGFGVAYRMLGSVSEAEPLLEDPAPGPAARAELADSLSLALLTLLERLTPVERAAYLLREAFGYEYAQIAEIIERSEANARQLVTRARKHLEASRPRFDADEAARDALLERFLAAAEQGDLAALEELLAKDAVLYADSGGKARAPQEPLVGAALIARYYAPPRQAGFGEVAGLQLRTSIDRREWGFDWQAELPGGGNAIGWDVEVEIDLLLMREDADAEK